MKKREKDHLRSMPAEELASERNKRKEEFFKLSFSQTDARAKNPLRLRILRREIAAIETWIHAQSKTAAAGGA